jgi:nucleolar protein 9
MDAESVVALCHDATSSRVIDAFIDSTSVPKSVKRKLSMSLIGYYHELVDDRIGSRVGDRLWDAAEPYLKEKIARSLLPHEQTIAGSEYGKYFARRLKLHILRKRPDEWKDMQSTVTAAPIEAPVVSAPAPVPEMSDRKPKRKVDEIDVLFDSAGLGAKKKRSTLKTVHAPDKSAVAEKAPGAFADLSDILGAIKAAPKSEKQAKKKKQPKTK